MDPMATFVLTAASLLLLPGPTNTLLATAGAHKGFVRAWGLR